MGIYIPLQTYAWSYGSRKIFGSKCKMKLGNQLELSFLCLMDMVTSLPNWYHCQFLLVFSSWHLQGWLDMVVYAALLAGSQFMLTHNRTGLHQQLGSAETMPVTIAQWLAFLNFTESAWRERKDAKDLRGPQWMIYRTLRPPGFSFVSTFWQSLLPACLFVFWSVEAVKPGSVFRVRSSFGQSIVSWSIQLWHGVPACNHNIPQNCAVTSKDHLFAGVTLDLIQHLFSSIMAS